MRVVIHLTEAESEAQQAMDLVCHLATHNNNPEYTAQTTRWCTPKEMLDGRWSTQCCPDGDYEGLTTKEYDPVDYPAPDEE